MAVFSVTLVVLALLAATFAVDAGWVEMTAKNAKDWGQQAGLALFAFAFWIAFRGDEK